MTERSEQEQALEASRERLRESERKADEQIERAERLEERAAELEAREERIRREMHEPQGPLLPPPPAPDGEP
ncbi:MAG TPA: hypothetical protein VFZ26_13875 [Gemmatimonadales bacterium]